MIQVHSQTSFEGCNACGPIALGSCGVAPMGRKHRLSLELDIDLCVDPLVDDNLALILLGSRRPFR